MRTTFDPVSIFHTCEAHPGGHVGTFTPTALVRLGCGCRRWRMRRCDNTRMEVVDGTCDRHAGELQEAPT